MKLQDIANNLKTQDSRCTAAPYLILLQEAYETVAADGYSYEDCRKVFVERITGDCVTFNSRNEALEYFIEIDQEIDSDDFVEEVTLQTHWRTVNVFFTTQGYAAHMNINKHNYGRTRTYIIHAFRNPEMDAVWELLTKEPI